VVEVVAVGSCWLSLGSAVTLLSVNDSIDLAVRGCASHPVLDGVGGLLAESPSAKRDCLLWGKTGRSMTGLPSGDEDGHVGSPEQTLSHL
jgi:hypothetical protein